MNISLTGNPFVDTGLAVLAFQSKCEHIDELTLEKMKEVHGDGSKLMSRNSKLKSMSIIFTVNSLATHPGIKPEKRVQYYSKVTTAILNKIGHEDIHERCESCGNEWSLDIDKLVREALVPLGYKDEVRYTGRDWFPLAGSVGSDAQALPAGSRSPNLCAKCLFAVHYLPQGVMLRDGRLVVFQSTSNTFWFDYVKSIAQTVEERILADNFMTLGAKAGSTAIIEQTFGVMEKMKKIEPGVSLFIWMFSNSGQGPDCRIEEIPNHALQFLFEARNEGFKKEILALVKKDKNPEYSFFNCISNGTDYSGLYPTKKYEGVPLELFLLYQSRIRKVPKAALKTACKVAKHLEESFADTKKFDAFRKDLKSDFAKRSKIKKCVVEMIDNGNLRFDEYYALFAKDSEEYIGLNFDSWKYVSYYTYHTDFDFEIDSEPIDSVINGNLLSFVGQKIFEGSLREKGQERFRKDVLDRLALGKISTPWLRRQFLKGAKLDEVFSYETWKALCLNEQGKENVYEVLFRLRLMWSEWLRTGNSPDFIKPFVVIKKPHELDLHPELKETVCKMVDDYVTNRGTARFTKEVVNDLILGDKDLYWFREKLSKYDPVYSEAGFWENLYADQDGYPIKNIRLFQLSLILINYFREQAFKQNIA